MGLCSESCSSVWLAILSGKNFNVGYYRQTFQPNFLIPAMLMVAIHFYHFIPLFLYFDRALWSQGQHKAKPVGFIFSRIFRLIRMKFDVLMKQFKLNILRLLLSKVYCFTGCVKKKL